MLDLRPKIERASSAPLRSTAATLPYRNPVSQVDRFKERGVNGSRDLILFIPKTPVAAGGRRRQQETFSSGRHADHETPRRPSRFAKLSVEGRSLVGVSLVGVAAGRWAGLCKASFPLVGPESDPRLTHRPATSSHPPAEQRTIGSSRGRAECAGETGKE
jgi:hypothetical protein